MKLNFNVKWCIVWAMMVLNITAIYAQREKNNIYLFDCTGSMQKNGLWEPAKAALDATITTQASIPSSQFIVIPFGDNPYSSFEFNSAAYQGKKADIAKAFATNIQIAKYTRISDVLQEGFSRVNPNKENKIYLLTDGMPNSGDTPEKVAQTITNWCSNHRNSRLFYVALTNGVVNPVIQQAIDACPDAFVVQCEGRVIPQIADISSDVYTNLEELAKAREVSFSIPGEYDLNVSTDDTLFHVYVDGDKASDGKILVSLSPKSGKDVSLLHQLLQGGSYTFTAVLQCKDKRYFIANPTLTIHVADEVPSKLTLADGQEEICADGVEWYDSFWWSDATPDQRVEWDLSPIFANQLNNTILRLKLEGENHDFQACYNDEPIGKDQVIAIVPNHPAMLQVLFNHDAETGKRYFHLVPAGHEALDMINEQPVANYEGTSLRTSYSVAWNPLKTLMFWLGVFILALLILWFVVLKPIFFPTIKIGKVEMTGPQAYYVSKRLKGARKVVFTSKKKSQNIISRMFTGEVRYVRADHFSPELAILPSGGKKKVKVRSEGRLAASWDVCPSTIFSQYEKGRIINRTSGDEAEIEFS